MHTFKAKHAVIEGIVGDDPVWNDVSWAPGLKLALASLIIILDKTKPYRPSGSVHLGQSTCQSKLNYIYICRRRSSQEGSPYNFNMAGGLTAGSMALDLP